MGYAILFPKPAKGGRGKKLTGTGEFSHQRLSEARYVLEHDPELALTAAPSSRLPAAQGIMAWKGYDAWQRGGRNCQIAAEVCQ